MKREAAYFSNLRHENIVELHGVCLDYPSIGLVLELCQGKLQFLIYGSSSIHYLILQEERFLKCTER